MSLKPMAFMSYAHVDNKYGQLTEFRERLSNEVQVQTGQEFPIFQDRDDILLGQNWKDRIEVALGEEVFFLIPIITPSFFNSDACREELELFIKRERALKRNDLVLPVYYVNCRILHDEALRANDPLAKAIASRQWADWRGLRFEALSSAQAGKALMQLAGQIQLALDRISKTTMVIVKGGGDITGKLLKSSSSIEIFYAYSHRDEQLRNELEKHLYVLKRTDLITGWHDRRIDPGAEWAGQIDKNLDTAQIILLLISADFLASDYCYDKEMIRAMERHLAGEAYVIPIILRPCDWGGTPFAKLQALPSDAKPVTTWSNRDKAFTNIAKGIAGLAQRIRKESAGQES